MYSTKSSISYHGKVGENVGPRDESVIEGDDEAENPGLTPLELLLSDIARVQHQIPAMDKQSAVSKQVSTLWDITYLLLVVYIIVHCARMHAALWYELP